MKLAQARTDVRLRPFAAKWNSAQVFATMRRETATADGRTLQMFFRLGYAGGAGPAPRRPFDAIVMKA